MPITGDDSGTIPEVSRVAIGSTCGEFGRRPIKKSGRSRTSNCSKPRRAPAAVDAGASNADRLTCPFGRRVKSVRLVPGWAGGQWAFGWRTDLPAVDTARWRGEAGPVGRCETCLSAQPAKPGVIGEKSSHSRRASVTLFPESRTDQQSSRGSLSLRSAWCDGSRLSYNDNQTRNPHPAKRTARCCQRT